MRSQWDLLPRRSVSGRKVWDVLPRRNRRPGAGALVLGLGLALVAAAVAVEPGGAPVAPDEQVAAAVPAGSGAVPAKPARMAPALDAPADQADQADPVAGSTASGAVETPASAPVGVGPASSAPPAQPPTRAGEPPKPDDVPGEWIVQLEEGESSEEVAADHEANEGVEVHHVYGAAVDGYSARMSDEEAEQVADDSRVVSVTRDRMVYATGETVPTGVRRIGAVPATIPATPVDVDVAIVDTGIAAHADLTIAGGKNCNGSGSSYNDGNGHGTHVAGTVGARNQNSGIVGVAPGARLWAVRVLNNSGSGSWSQVICGLDWVRTRPSAEKIEVVNMSLGGSGTEGSSCNSSTLRAAICNLKNAGTTIVVAAGNDHKNANGFVPATFPEVVTVSALADFNGLPGGGAGATCRSDVDDTFANFSNYGSDVDVIAPGVCITSTARGGGTAVMSGTSMASPHAAGVAALFKAANPGASPDAVRSYLISTGNSNWNNSDDGDSTKEPLIAAGPPPSPTPTVPTASITSATCDNLTCSFTGSGNDADGGGVTYSWNFGDGSSAGSGASVSHTYASGTGGTARTVTLTVTDTDTPPQSATATTTVTPVNPTAPTANITSATCDNLACSFTGSGGDADGGGVTYSWNFGDGTAAASGTSVSHTYASSTAGTPQTVTLTVTDTDTPAQSTTAQTTVTPTTPPPSVITLTLDRNSPTSNKVILQWSGATGEKVEIWRGSSASPIRRITTTKNDGYHTNSPSRGFTYTYKVCQVGGTVCSAEQQITV